MTFVINTLIAAFVIAVVSWLSARAPMRAGLIAALPLSTMMILPMAEAEHGNSKKEVWRVALRILALGTWHLGGAA